MAVNNVRHCFLFDNIKYTAVLIKPLSDFVALLTDLDLTSLHTVFTLSFRITRPEETS